MLMCNWNNGDWVQLKREFNVRKNVSPHLNSTTGADV
jgi:hypothetical protein